MSDAGREARAKARATWPVERHALTDSSSELLRDLPPSARVAMVWSLTLDAWAISGRSLPDYARADAPGRIARGGR